MITICFDFGNTRMKAAVFNKDELTETVYLADDKEETMLQLLQQYQPQKSILSSVINHNPVIETLLAAHTQFHKLSHLTKINFTIPVGKPETVGADRLALMAAAVHFFPGKNNLVIRFSS